MVAPSVLLFGILFAGFASAQPLCNAFSEGTAGCLANKQCLCRFDPGGSMTGRPAGYRWDCGAFRPACELPPPSLPPTPFQSMPPPLPYWDAPFATPPVRDTDPTAPLPGPAPQHGFRR